MSSRQLAKRVGISQSNITRLEERETSGKVSLELVARAAEALNCKLVYSIVPSEQFDSFDAIVTNQARALAEEIVRKTEHSMRLEKQAGHPDDMELQVERLTAQLKATLDSRIWDVSARRG